LHLTPAITWPQGVIDEADSLAVAAQVHGGVREWQERQDQEVVASPAITIAITSEETYSMNFAFLDRQSRLFS
jgi:hypothetical protein